jgi:hypothetical protein
MFLQVIVQCRLVNRPRPLWSKDRCEPVRRRSRAARIESVYPVLIRFVAIGQGCAVRRDGSRNRRRIEWKQKRRSNEELCSGDALRKTARHQQVGQHAEAHDHGEDLQRRRWIESMDDRLAEANDGTTRAGGSHIQFWRIHVCCSMRQSPSQKEVVVFGHQVMPAPVRKRQQDVYAYLRQQKRRHYARHESSHTLSEIIGPRRTLVKL